MSTNPPNAKSESGLQLFARLVSSSQRTPPTQSQAPRQSTGQSENLRPTQMLNEMGEMLMINKKLDLDGHLFQNGGIANKELIEITGPPSSGKTELLIHLISRFLFPTKWRMNLTEQSLNESVNSQSRVVELDLSEISCHSSSKVGSSSAFKTVLVDTEANFSIGRLYSVMEARLVKILDEQFNLKYSAPNPPADDHKSSHWPKIQRHLKNFITERLKNFILIKCFTSEEYIYALGTLDHLMQKLAAPTATTASSQPSFKRPPPATSLNYIMPVFIDSINSNYEFIDKYNSKLDAESYSLANVNITARNPATNRYDLVNAPSKTENYAIILIRKLIERHNTCIIATRSDLLVPGQSKDKINFSNLNQFKKWQSMIHQRIELTRLTTERHGLADELVEEDDQGNETLKSELELALQRHSVKETTKSHIKVSRASKQGASLQPETEAAKFDTEIDQLVYKIDQSGFVFIEK